MKKIILSAALLTAVSLSTFAQEKGFYIKPTGSYFMKVTPVEFPAINGMPARDRTVTVTGTNTEFSETALTGSFGQGFRAGLVGGYKFTDVVGLELGINYFQSEKQDMMKQRYIQDGNMLTELNTYGQVTAFDVAPALVLHLPTTSDFRPYAKVGVIVPVAGYLQINTSLQDNTGQFAADAGIVSPPGTRTTLMIDREEKINPRPTIGFQSALGFDYKLGNRISFFSELEYRNVSVGGDNKELKSYEGTASVVVNATGTVAGTRQLTLAEQPLGEREVNYHKTIRSGMNVKGQPGYDPTRPSDDLRSYINIGGLGLNVGLKFML